MKLDGEEILAPVYDDLGWSNGLVSVLSGTLGFQENDKWGLLSLAGKRITPPVYDKLLPIAPDLFLVANKGKFTNRFFYGLINAKGKIQLNQDYFEIERAGDVLLLTVLENQKFLMGARSISLIDICAATYHQVEVAGDVVIARSSSGHLDLFRVDGTVIEKSLDKVRLDGDFLITTRKGFDGLVRKSGEVIHRPIHKEIISHDEVIAFPTWEVRTGGEDMEIAADSVTFISRGNLLKHLSGTVSFHPEREDKQHELKQLVNGFSVLKTIPEDLWVALDPYRKEILRSRDSIYFDGAFFYKSSYDGWTVFNRQGQKLSDKRFDVVVPMNRQYLAVKKFGFYAILDGIQKSISEFRYDKVQEITGRKAIVRYVNKWGVFQAEKEWLIQPDFDSIRWVNNHFLATNKSGYFLFSRDGRLLFRTIDVIAPQEDYFTVTFEGKKTVIGSRGRPIAPVEFKSVREVGDYFVLKNNFSEVRSAYGIIKIDSTQRVEDVYDFSEGLFLIKKNGAFGFLDEQGRLRIANRYDSARSFSEGMAAIQLRGKWGFIDSEERLAIQPHYDEVGDFKDGVSVFKLNGKYGFLTQDAKELSKPIYSMIQKTESGLYVVKNENRYGLANSRGIIVISPTYEFLEEQGDYFIARLGEKYGLLNKDGQSVTLFEYSAIRVQEEVMMLRKSD